MPYDWLTSSPEARKRLYQSCKRIVDRQYGGNWSRLYDAVFSQKEPFGTGYEDNFRAGRIGRINANAIAQWIASTYPDDSAVLHASFGQENQIGATGDILSSLFAEKGGTHTLAIVTIENGDLAIVGLAQRRNDQTYRLRLGQMFCLDLTVAQAGTALAFQLYEGRWYPLPLTDRTLTASVETGTHVFPRSIADGAPLPLSEEKETGRFKFAVLITQAPVTERLALMLEEGVEIAPATQAAIVEAVMTADLPFEVFTADALIS